MKEKNNPIEDFKAHRLRMNELILSKENLIIKRFFNLDAQTYKEGALPSKFKEMLGLVASMVLRCDHCIQYHLEKCKEHGCSEEEIYEVFSIACIVGGSIVIPHLRKAAEYWEYLNSTK